MTTDGTYRAECRCGFTVGPFNLRQSAVGRAAVHRAGCDLKMALRGPHTETESETQ